MYQGNEIYMVLVEIGLIWPTKNSLRLGKNIANTYILSN